MLRSLDRLGRDIRHAWRSLRRARGFSATASLSLALGIGATTVIYAVVDHIALRPLPYADPERLIVVREIVPILGARYPTLPASAAAYSALREQCRSCEQVAAILPRGLTLSGDGDPERINGLGVSANLFTTLGARPALGRWFSGDEDQAGRDRVAIVSEELWRRRFAADSSLVGRSIVVDDQAYVVVGILPTSFRPPTGSDFGELLGLAKNADLFVPLALSAEQMATPYLNNYGVLVRRRTGVTHAQLAGEVATIDAGVADRLKIKTSAVVIPLAAQVVGASRVALLLLLAAVAALLIMVCLNVGSLFAARWAQRARESALRAAIGASRGRLISLAIVESLLLSVIGGGVGMALSRWGLQALIRSAPSTIPRLDEVHLDWRVLAVGICLTTIVGVAFGAVPAIRAARVNPAELLVSASRIRGGWASTRAGRVLIGSQVGVSVLLLVTTGLLLASFVNVLGVDKGFVPDRIVSLEVVPPSSLSEQQRIAYYDQAVARVSAVPGVVGAAAITVLPLSGEDDVGFAGTEHDPFPPVNRPPVNIRFVTPTYFSVIGVPLRRGRSFTDADNGHLVTVLSESAAAALWPGEEAIGKRVSGMGPAPTVIGVVADVRTTGLDRDVSPIVYVPHWFISGRPTSIIVKVAGRPEQVAATARAELMHVDPRVPVSRPQVLDAVVRAALAERRFQLAVLGLFAITALITASIGVYGVVVQWVANRRGEIGIRMALGATPARVRRLVLREGLGPSTVGAMVGVAAALLAGQGLRGFLYGVQPTDAGIVTLATVVVAIVAGVACYLPARRAVQADPVISLRVE